MSADGKNLGGLSAWIGANLTGWNKAMMKVQADLGNFAAKGVAASKTVSQSMDRAGASMVRAGGKLTTRLSLPLLAASGAATKLADDFDVAFAKIQGLVGVSADETERMKKAVLDLGGTTGQTPLQLADALFFITSAGLRGQEALDVLEASAKAATAGLGQTKTVADLVTSAVNAYGVENLNAAQATDVLVAAVREGKAEAPALAQSMGQVLPIASNLGVTFDQVGAAVASMTRTGTDAATASIQLRQILASLLKPSDQAEDALKEMGTSSAELRKQLKERGLISVLGFLAKEMETNEQAMAQVFPNIRALSGALDIMGANSSDNVAIFNRMKDATGTLDDAFGSMADTTRFAAKEAFAELQKEAIRVGQLLLPTANKILEFAKTAIRAFGQLSEQTRLRIVKLAAAAVLLGPLVTGIGLALKGLALLMAPIVIKMIALAAVFAATVTVGQWFVDNWEKISLKTAIAMESIVLSFQKMGLGVLMALKHLMGQILLRTPAGLLMTLFGINPQEAAAGATGLQDGINKMMMSIAQGNERLKSLIKKDNELTWGSIPDAAKSAFDKTEEIAKGFYEKLKTFGLGGLDAIPIGGSSSGGTGGGSGPVGNMMNHELFTQLPDHLDNLRVSSTSAADAVNTNLRKVSVSMGETTKKGVALGQALQTSLTGAITEFASTIADAFTGDAGAEGFFDNILLIVASFGEQLGKSLVAAGVAALAFQQLLVNPFAAIAAGAALIIASRAVRNQLQRGPAGQETSVNDALITSDGKVIKFHPDDNILAMKDFGPLKAGMAGLGSSRGTMIPITLNLNGRPFYQAMVDYQEKEDR